VVPGSHRLDLDPSRFDAERFFVEARDENRAVLEGAVDVGLNRGDVLFFHCRLLHAAGRNESDRVKRSLVFTYNRQDNPAIPGTRSSRLAQLPL
jgi:phytanoyl-CoA hydroxylase